MLELETFVEEHLGDPFLHFRSNRIEENEDDECRHHDVEEELVARDEPHQPENEGQHERERRQHAEAAGELVEVDQAVMGDRPGQRVQEDEDQDRADRGDVEAGIGEVLDQGEEGAEAADQRNVTKTCAFNV